MSMNRAELNHIVKWLDQLRGQPVTGIWQPERDRVVVSVGTTLLLFVPRGPFARLVPIPGRPPNPERPFSFQGACRAHLVGPLTHVETFPDRMVSLHFGSCTLHLRLTGRSGGLWLTRDQRVLAAYDGPAPQTLPILVPNSSPERPTRFEPSNNENWGQAAYRWFQSAEKAWKQQQSRSEALQRIDRTVDRLLRLQQALYKDLQQAEDAPRLRRAADALAAHLHTLRKGTQEVTFADLEDDSILHKITIDPNQPPFHSLQRLYHRAGRLDRSTDRILAQLDRIDLQLQDLRSLRQRVECDPEDTWLPHLPKVPQAVPKDPAQLPWREWTGSHGERVLVGRNEAGNRRLTFQVGRGRDYWMHLRHQPGAHLLLPMKNGQSPSLPHLLAAAELALIYGKCSEAEVQYTQIRNLRSLPGTVAGVLVHEEKVLKVRRNEGALLGWQPTE